MTWLEGSDWRLDAPGERLAALWQRREILRIPGAHNALAGLLAQRAGFECLYVSGGGLSASLGLPDIGLMSLDEVCFFVRSIYRATRLPLIVDADTGYGEPLNVMRTVRELEAAGAAAIQIEDQVMPKKCGHLDGKRVVPVEEMAAKVAAARRARTDIRIIARTDAAAVEGLDAAIARAKRYVAAGADAVFPDALTDAEMFRRFSQEVDVPVLANMTEFGKTPQMTATQFEKLGCKMVIWPVSALRLAARAMEDTYAELADVGSAEALIEDMQTREELYETIGYHDYGQLDREIAGSVGGVPVEPPARPSQPAPTAAAPAASEKPAEKRSATPRKKRQGWWQK